MEDPTYKKLFQYEEFAKMELNFIRFLNGDYDENPLAGELFLHPITRKPKNFYDYFTGKAIICFQSEKLKSWAIKAGKSN